MDFSQKYNVYAPNMRKKAKCVAEGTMYQNQLFHPCIIVTINDTIVLLKVTKINPRILKLSNRRGIFFQREGAVATAAFGGLWVISFEFRGHSEGFKGITCMGLSDQGWSCLGEWGFNPGYDLEGG